MKVLLMGLMMFFATATVSAAEWVRSDALVLWGKTNTNVLAFTTRGEASTWLVDVKHCPVVTDALQTNTIAEVEILDRVLKEGSTVEVVTHDNGQHRCDVASVDRH